MKFAHLADVHLGNWRDETMKSFVEKAFSLAVDECVNENVDFVLISGDLFNTAMPSVSHLKLVINKLKTLKNRGIRVYYIAGSHDFSASGKTMLDIIEEAGLGVNVTKGEVTSEGKLRLKFTNDSESGAKITGLIGRKGTLEKRYYENLDVDYLRDAKGFKVFMFHTAIDELKPKELTMMEGSPISFLPSGFDYYAGGHVHIVNSISMSGYRNVVYPGPIFPANTAELEKLGEGSFFIYENGDVRKKPVKVVDLAVLNVFANSKDSFEVKNELWSSLSSNYDDKLVLIKLTGRLSSGKALDLDLKNLVKEIYERGALHVLKSTSGLQAPQYESSRSESKKSDDIESEVISESSGKFKHPFIDEKEAFFNLMNALRVEKVEGETNADFEERLLKDIEAVMVENLK